MTTLPRVVTSQVAAPVVVVQDEEVNVIVNSGNSGKLATTSCLNIYMQSKFILTWHQPGTGQTKKDVSKLLKSFGEEICAIYGTTPQFK